MQDNLVFVAASEERVAAAMSSTSPMIGHGGPFIDGLRFKLTGSAFVGLEDSEKDNIFPVFLTNLGSDTYLFVSTSFKKTMMPDPNDEKKTAIRLPQGSFNILVRKIWSTPDLTNKERFEKILKKVGEKFIEVKRTDMILISKKGDRYAGTVMDLNIVD